METNGYVQLFEEINARVGNDEVAIAIVEQIGKDARVERMQAGNSGVSSVRNGDQPATSKQIGYLKVLNVEVPEGLTKQQASDLIDQHNQAA